MALWNKSGKMPADLIPTEKRNVIATKDGWTRRITYTDVHGNERVKEIPLVAIGNLDSLSTMNNPVVTDIYVENATGGSSLAANTNVKLCVSFSEAITIGASAVAYTINVTDSANATITATSNTNPASVKNADNTLVFSFKTNAAGAYTIKPQTMAAGNLVYSTAGGATETVNAVIATTTTFTVV